MRDAMESVAKKFRQGSPAMFASAAVFIVGAVIAVTLLVVRSSVTGDADTNAWLEGRLADLEAGAATPFGIADALLERSANLLTRTS